MKIKTTKKKFTRHLSTWGCLGETQKLLNLTTSNLKQTKTFLLNKKISTKFNRSGSRTFMTSEKELNVVLSNGYQLVNSCWCPKSPGLTSDKILLLFDESLLKGEDRKKNTIHKSESSNLLVDKTNSVAKLSIFVYSIALKLALSNSKIYVSENQVI